MPDKKLTDSEIVKEIQGIKESMKRHIDLTNEIGQDLLRIDEEYTGGSKVCLTTDYFKKVVKHFCHSNYLVKCLELVFDLINRQQEENENYSKNNQQMTSDILALYKALKTAKTSAYKEFAERLESIMYEKYQKYDDQPYPIATISIIDNLLKEMTGEQNA